MTNLPHLLHQKHLVLSPHYCLFSGDSSVHSLRFSLLSSSRSGTSFLVIIKHQKLHIFFSTSRTVMTLSSSPSLTQQWAIHWNVLWSCFQKPHVYIRVHFSIYIMNAFSSMSICIRIDVLLSLSETRCCWALIPHRLQFISVCLQIVRESSFRSICKSP